MFRKLPESSGAVLGYAVTGRLTADEVARMQADALAVVGETNWHEWAARLSKVIAEARYFGDVDEAWAWLREGSFAR